MRLMSDTSQTLVLLLREGLHVNCQCHICHSTSITDQAQSYKRLRMGSPYMVLLFKSVSPQLSSDCSVYLATVSFSKLANTFCNVTPHNMKSLKCLSCSGLNASSIPTLKDSFTSSQWFKAQLEKFCLGLKLGISHKNSQ